jgi:hypothetical protein
MDFKYNCNKCDYHCQYPSQWSKHKATTLHKTGKRKIRNDKKDDHSCPECKYSSRIASNIKLHYLNNHANESLRIKEFTYYCKLCKFGCFNDVLFNRHIETSKHIDLMKEYKKKH